MFAGDQLEKHDEIGKQVPIKSFTVLETHNDLLHIIRLKIVIEYLEIIIEQF